MPALGIRTSTADALSNQRQAALWGILGALHLGVPAVYNDGTNDWYVYDDPRISRDDLSWIGAYAANINDVPETYHVPILQSLIVDIDQLRTDARAFLSARRVAPLEIDPDNPPANPWQDVLDANSAPAVVRAADSVPASWTPVEGGS